MSVHNPAGSSLKPSGSPTRSSGHSPTNSPNDAPLQRKQATGVTGNMFGVALGNTTGLKGLDSGWQVWGSTSPASRRHASISSATGVTDLTSSLPLHHTRQWPATAGPTSTFPGPRVDDRPPGPAMDRGPPQRYDNAPTKDTSAAPYSATSPTQAATPFGGGSYVGQPSGLPANPGGYEHLQTSATVENDLSLALRGIAVDNYSAARQPPVPQHMPNRRHSPQTGLPAVIQPPRPPYNTYPQPDFAPYYSGGPGREPYIDYQYGYDTYRGPPDPSMYPSPGSTSPANLYPGLSPQPLHHNVVDVHRQQTGPFYDYRAAPQPQAAPFFYANPQPMIYPPPSHSPMLTPQLSPLHPAAHVGKKREVAYNMQPQLVPPNLAYSPIRSSPSPHSAYVSMFDYNVRLPHMVPGGPIYPHGLHMQSMHIYQQGVRHTRRDGLDAPGALHSPLFNEFKANRARKWELRDIFGHIVEFCGDQHGSRFIQQKLEVAPSEEKQIVFDEIVPDNALQLIQDVFGNYVIQKLFEHGTQVQKTVLASTMEGHILPLSLQMYGCRVVQKGIEYILPDQQGAFVKELELHVLRCVKDANGNHVIQRLVERVSPDRLTFVHSFRGNVYDLSTHPYGCRVLQRCLEHLPEEYTRPLLDELHKYTANLMQDQFGNYVVQFILEHGKPQDRAYVLAKLRGQMLNMARHRFASNVCEKALVSADPEERRQLIDEIMTPKQDGVSPVVAMMKDQFANFVLQRALSVVGAEQKDTLVGLIRPQLVNMQRYSSAYSKHLISIERMLEKYAPAESSASH